MNEIYFILPGPQKDCHYNTGVLFHTPCASLQITKCDHWVEAIAVKCRPKGHNYTPTMVAVMILEHITTIHTKQW